jgi:hypothetical protein
MLPVVAVQLAMIAPALSAQQHAVASYGAVSAAVTSAAGAVPASLTVAAAAAVALTAARRRRAGSTFAL